jgi:hypothetical protein
MRIEPSEIVSKDAISNPGWKVSYRGVSGRKGMVQTVTMAKKFWKAMGNLQTTSPVKFLTVP